MRRLLPVMAATLAASVALALPAPAIPGPDAVRHSAVLDPALARALAASPSSLEVIVTFTGAGAPTTADLRALTDAGISRGVTMRSLPMAGVVATPQQVEALRSSSAVRSVFLNSRLTYDNAEATTLTGVKAVRRDATMTQRNGGLPITGHGVGVLVNDSGIDGTHRDHKLGANLAQNVLGATNLNSLSTLLPITYTENVPNTDSTGGHGTHVAGIVGATGAMSGGRYEGVAPGADLIGYGSGAALLILDTLGGFDYALTHQRQYGIKVVTNSWGNTGDVGTAFNPDDPVNVATHELYRRGVVVVFSAGNSGPGEDTITGNFKKAPWVVTVAAGDKQGRLTDFSSRGTSRGGTVEVDGRSYTWSDQPTVTAPGNQIVSTRAIAPVSSLGATDDVETIEPAYLPFYTTMSGTSMAAPHAAGVIALMLEANPTLTPDRVKATLRETATNISGRQAWEAGAGYLNAYGAVAASLGLGTYGGTVNELRSFSSSVDTAATRLPVSVDYNPVVGSSNRVTFSVPAGTTEVVGRVNANGIDETTGNPVNLVLVAPDGTEHSSGVSVLFPLYPDRTVSVPNPAVGEWVLEVRGLRGAVGLPEKLAGSVTLKRAGERTGLRDIAKHPAQTWIASAVASRLVDGYPDGSYRPDKALTRAELADYLTMGAAIRQSGRVTSQFGDISTSSAPFVEAVVARGAALRDQPGSHRGVMLPPRADRFAGADAVTRSALAYSLVQSLGLEESALAKSGGKVTVAHDGRRIPVVDTAKLPADLVGYVQLAIDLNILNCTFETVQGPFDLQPTLQARFNPDEKVTRAAFAVAISRFAAAFLGS